MLFAGRTPRDSSALHYIVSYPRLAPLELFFGIRPGPLSLINPLADGVRIAGLLVVLCRYSSVAVLKVCAKAGSKVLPYCGVTYTSSKVFTDPRVII